MMTMDEVTDEGPGLLTQAQRDDIAVFTYIQLSRIYDVLLFQSKDIEGIDALIESHKNGKLFGPEPALDTSEE